MIDKELSDYIKGVVSTYGAITTQAIGEFIVQYLTKNFGTPMQRAKVTLKQPADYYNDLCKEIGLLNDSEDGR